MLHSSNCCTPLATAVTLARAGRVVHGPASRVGFVVGGFAVVFGGMGVSSYRRGRATNCGMSWWGVGLGIYSAVMSAVIIALI